MVVAEIKVPEVIAEQETPVKIESPEDKVLRAKQEKGDRGLQEPLYARKLLLRSSALRRRS